MNPPRPRRFFRTLGRFVLMGFGYALCVPLLEWGFEDHVTLQHLVGDYFIALAYAFSIGGLLSTTLATVWQRSCPWNIAIRWPVRALAVAGGTAIGCLIAGLAPLAALGPRYDYWPAFLASFKIGLVLSAAAVTFAVNYERMRSRLQVSALELKNKELERQRALKLATDARLSSLESRMRPHFLFNTINSVSSLIPEDPKRAERMLTQMANLLRFSLDSSQTGLVPLEREMKIVEDYLDIERARFGDRLKYELSVEPHLDSACVPPLALQTLAENAVKYAVGARRQGAAIRIWAMAEAGSLVLEVCDDGPGFRAAELPSGHGLHNLQERLAVVFGEKARLEISSTPEGTSVRIEIPLVIAEPPAPRPASETRAGIALQA
ncbi:MAG: sensor histidine kinase [Acidobacteriaceae bacterium]|nr:sensor histidine kinase [Acidobacteriaceae bacterium]